MLLVGSVGGLVGGWRVYVGRGVVVSGVVVEGEVVDGWGG